MPQLLEVSTGGLFMESNPLIRGSMSCFKIRRLVGIVDFFSSGISNSSVMYSTTIRKLAATCL